MPEKFWEVRYGGSSYECTEAVNQIKAMNNFINNISNFQTGVLVEFNLRLQEI
jgi:hypothetical protein